MDQDLAEIDVATLANAEQLRLASRRVLPWHQAKPRSKVSSLAKGSSVADSRDDGGGYDRADPEDLPDAGASRIRGGDLFQFKAEHFNLFFPPSSTHAREDR